MAAFLRSRTGFALSRLATCFGRFNWRSRTRSVAIVNSVNTTVTPAGGGAYNVVKTGGVGGTYDASAVSNIGLAGDFTLRLRNTSGNQGCYGGMNATPLVDSGGGGLLGWQLFSTYTAYENNVARTAGLAPTTYAWVWRRNGTLFYGRGSFNAALAAPDFQTANAAVLFFDSTFFAVNESLEALLTF